MSTCLFPLPDPQIHLPQIEEDEIHKAVQGSLDVQCFIPKDRRITNRYRIADFAIRTLSFSPISLNSAICSRMILSYCKDKVDPDNQSFEKFPQDKLESIVNKLAESRFITPGPYRDFLHPIAVYGSCEQQLEFRAKRREELAHILFPHLSLSEQAKIKVDTDRISLFLRLQEKFPSLEKFCVTSARPYLEQSEEIKKGVVLENSSLEIEELNLDETRIQTIPPEFFYHFKGVKKLSFAGNESSSLSILSLIAQMGNLEELDLSRNAFTSLPPSFFRDLHQLQKINLRNNAFPPEEIARIAAICQEKGITLEIQPQTIVSTVVFP